MKRSKLDKLVAQREILVRKIKAYERVRQTINSLVAELKDDPYALEALNAIDRTIFTQLRFMYLGLETLNNKIKQLAGGGGSEETP
jgi:hypothetical protein